MRNARNVAIEHRGLIDIAHWTREKVGINCRGSAGHIQEGAIIYLAGNTAGCTIEFWILAR